MKKKLLSPLEILFSKAASAFAETIIGGGGKWGKCENCHGIFIELNAERKTPSHRSKQSEKRRIRHVTLIILMKIVGRHQSLLTMDKYSRF